MQRLPACLNAHTHAHTHACSYAYSLWRLDATDAPPKDSGPGAASSTAAMSSATPALASRVNAISGMRGGHDRPKQLLYLSGTRDQGAAPPQVPMPADTHMTPC